MTTNEPEALFRRPLYVYDLPPEILTTLQLKIDNELILTGESELQSDTSQPETPSFNGPKDGLQDGNPGRTISCTLCGVSFVNVQEQRSHARSDLHGYNLKQKMRGLQPVNEVDFEKLVEDLDESISGSESSSGTESENEDGTKSRGNATMLSALLKKQANLENTEVDVFTKKRKRGSGKPPFLWFTSPTLPSNISLGIYRAIFTQAEQEVPAEMVNTLRKKQLPPNLTPKRAPDEGGVPLPPTYSSPHIFLCMVGGGHFAGMIVSLAPKLGKKHGVDERQATVLAHKTFHRYTTRRKQGGSQSSNDAAKGAAHSAGASIRRYNEVALEIEIRQLLTEWKTMIDTSELLFIRATSTTNRRALFGPYESQVLRQDDPRNRGFPFSTRRATQAELMRSFVEITRVKVSQIDEAALAAEQAKAAAEAEAQHEAAAAKAKSVAAKPAPVKNPEEEVALLHTMQIEALVRRSKAPALLSYISTNTLPPDFRLHPLDSQAHYHAPTPLHMAASINSAALVTALLLKAGADPTVTSPDGKTAFELAGDRATRDAFRQARAELGDEKWEWEAAKVPEPLTRAEVEGRAERERKEQAEKEEERRKAGVEKIKEEEKRREDERRKGGDERRDKRHGKGRLLSGKEMTAEQRREEEARGMTPEARMRLEREKRARAAEERMRRLAAGAAAGR